MGGIDFSRFASIRTRQYKLLLYADNPLHMRCLHTIRRELADDYIGIWHTSFDDHDEEIIHGASKKHCHILLDLPNARYWGAMVDALGLGTGDNWRFCLHIRYGFSSRKGKEVLVDKRKVYTLKKGFVYFVHRDDPTKDQLPQSALWGSDRLLVAAKREIDEYEARQISPARALTYFQAWLVQQDRRISFYSVAARFNGTPYQSVLRHPLLRDMICEHNAVIAMRRSKFDTLGDNHMSATPSDVRSHRDYIERFESTLESVPGWNPFLEDQEAPF